jgi:hypothetical protein
VFFLYNFYFFLGLRQYRHYTMSMIGWLMTEEHLVEWKLAEETEVLRRLTILWASTVSYRNNFALLSLPCHEDILNNGRRESHILNFDTGWGGWVASHSSAARGGWVASHSSAALLRGKYPRHPLNMRLVRPQDRSENRGENLLPLKKNRTPNFQLSIP